MIQMLNRHCNCVPTLPAFLAAVGHGHVKWPLHLQVYLHQRPGHSNILVSTQENTAHDGAENVGAGPVSSVSFASASSSMAIPCTCLADAVRK